MLHFMLLHVTFSVTSQVKGIIWALKFPSLSSYRDFAEHLDDYAFENEFGVPNDDVVSVSCTGVGINTKLWLCLVLTGSAVSE